MTPVVFNETTLTRAWAAVVQYLLTSGGRSFNVVVHVADPARLDSSILQAYDHICDAHKLLGSRHVAYTIFPQSLYEKFGREPKKLFDLYNRPHGVFDRVRRRKASWGTYFRRLTHWPEEQPGASGTAATYVNQLDRTIESLSCRERMFRSAYVMSLWSPTRDSKRVRGAPCLLSLALQLERTGEDQVLNILALYRNHNFVDRALGNYLGLAQLQQFLCNHTPYVIGSMTCVSSNATIATNVTSGATWPTHSELEGIANLALAERSIRSR